MCVRACVSRVCEHTRVSLCRSFVRLFAHTTHKPTHTRTYTRVHTEGMGLYIPIELASCYDIIVAEDTTKEEMLSEIMKKMRLVFMLHWGGICLGFFRGTIIGVSGERVVARLRAKLYSHLLVQDLAFFDKTKVRPPPPPPPPPMLLLLLLTFVLTAASLVHTCVFRLCGFCVSCCGSHTMLQTGDLVSRLGSDTTLIQQLATASLPSIVLGLIKVCACIVLMIVISPKLAGFTFLVVFFLLATTIPAGMYIGKLSKKYADALADAAGKSTEALGGMRTVRSFGAERKETDRYKSKIGDPEAHGWFPGSEKQTTYLYGVKKAIFGSGVVFFFGFGVAFSALYGSLWVGFVDVVEGRLSLGMMVAFQNYVFQVVLALGASAGHFTAALTARGAAARVFELLAQQSEVECRGEVKLVKEKVEGAVEFKDVTFAYPGRKDMNVLEKFSLKIEPRTTVALVGSSGAGKSTVISLLERFYDLGAGGGAVLVDGLDVKTIQSVSLRNCIGLVQQEPTLFGFTIRENVCYGLERDVSDDEVKKACALANAESFINDFPEGYETMVGERGVKLSGGQKQRLAIARALLVDPKILLFDEATSALDAESEFVVQQAIERLMVGRTTIIVAHRLSTVRKADKIVVVDNHRGVDEGTHEELYERCDKYRDLVKLQMGGKEAN